MRSGLLEPKKRYLTALNGMRPTGVEPATFGLKDQQFSGRCLRLRAEVRP
jgi:hypothetical protein